MINIYGFEDADGNISVLKTMNVAEAYEYASIYHLRIITNVYEFSHSQLLADFTQEKG